MAKDYISKNTEEINKFLSGERKSNRICTTVKVANILQRRLNVQLTPCEQVNEKLGLYMWQILK